ncbi:MAG: thioredoxin domain-containing protein [Candidatus Paracaedibacteraceae bacterium]|nr:thioredoxin domain-containing protein [Candidatus Paracaedibacteraceae bacterium]
MLRTLLDKSFVKRTLINLMYVGMMANGAFSDANNHPKQPKIEQESLKNDPHENDLNNVEPFPFIWLKPQLATLGAPTNQDCDTISANAQYTITAYFSPTCGHCGIFFNTTLSDIQIKYINTGKIKFGFRPYCHHVIDFVVSQLSASKGPEHFQTLFSLFMKNQPNWFEYLMIPDKEEKKKKEAIEKMIAALPSTIDTKKALITLNINEQNPSSSVLLFALKNGFTVEEIDTAINSQKAQELTDRLIVGTLAAKTDKGESVPGIPSFYINDQYQDDPLTIEDFKSLTETGKIIERKKGPTQTVLPSASKITAAGKAFEKIQQQ